MAAEDRRKKNAKFIVDPIKRLQKSQRASTGGASNLDRIMMNQQ